MGHWRIPLYKVFVDKQDVKFVSDVIKRGMDWAIGPEIEKFEEQLARYVGSRYSISFNSGTSALHASLLAAGIRNHEKVVVPSFTFIATANAVLMVGGRPTFVDIEEETLGLDPRLVEKNTDSKTRCIIPVHYAGMACKIEDIAEISRRKRLILIEDAAESLGSTINKKMVGTFGQMSVFSFAGNKVVTTGEGGAVTTDSKPLFEKLKLIRSHGRHDKQNYFSSVLRPTYVALGYNWRMSTMTAALAMSQLGKIEKLIDMRRKNAQFLNSRLEKIGIKVPKEPKGYRHAYQLYSVLLPSAKVRDGLMKYLASKGIMSKIFFDPVHLSSFYKKLGYGRRLGLEVTESVSQRILTLPMYPGLNREELSYICDSVAEFVE